jgi:acetyl-CoA carboxylase biotin carboxyl carrier protein
MKRKKKAQNRPARVDFGAVERVLEFMTLHGIDEFEYSDGELRIRLKKPGVTSERALPRSFAPPDIVVANPPPEVSGRSVGTRPRDAEGDAEEAPGAAREAADEAGRAEDLQIIKSPIVGTFYEAPSPGAEPFVEVGDHVTLGQVLCIIEAMKLMNEIESDAAGEIIRIYVENGQPVEYGESLFALRPSRKK